MRPATAPMSGTATWVSTRRTSSVSRKPEPTTGRPSTARAVRSLPVAALNACTDPYTAGSPAPRDQITAQPGRFPASRWYTLPEVVMPIWPAERWCEWSSTASRAFPVDPCITLFAMSMAVTTHVTVGSGSFWRGSWPGVERFDARRVPCEMSMFRSFATNVLFQMSTCPVSSIQTPSSPLRATTLSTIAMVAESSKATPDPELSITSFPVTFASWTDSSNQRPFPALRRIALSSTSTSRLRVILKPPETGARLNRSVLLSATSSREARSPSA